ncbi:MAG: hypothetical protein ACYC5N_07540, partial [Endomicrobiales bacterium]
NGVLLQDTQKALGVSKPGSLKNPFYAQGREEGKIVSPMIDEEQITPEEREKAGASILAAKLNDKPLDARGNGDTAKAFLRGGYQQEGYGVAEGAAVNGSFAFTGDQGYYTKDARGVETGKQVFLEGVNRMREFFQRRDKVLEERYIESLSVPGRLWYFVKRAGNWARHGVRMVVKPGIGGQHTPFQGIADAFRAMVGRGAGSTVISGEFELGKDYEAALDAVRKQMGLEWSQIATMPSSKSGSTDETMIIFSDILYIMLKQAALRHGLDGKGFAETVFNTLNEINLPGGKERPGKDLFKVDTERFGTDSLITLLHARVQAGNPAVTREQVTEIFRDVLGNMFFETTDRVDQSRLSAFIHNSGLENELGADARNFVEMFDNVGGRWTGDLHMMAFLAYYGLDAEAYWEARNEGIRQVKEGLHAGVALADRILNEGITDIALVVPDELFWFGKSIEQNFNESIWQEGFVNLVTVKQSHWDAQKHNYAGKQNRLVIDLTARVEEEGLNVFALEVPALRGLGKQGLAEAYADLFTAFYGMTSTVGNRLIVRALHRAGHSAEDVDLSDLNNPATMIVQANLYVRQPFVELGKGLLESRLKELQQKEAVRPGAIAAAMAAIQAKAREGALETTVQGLGIPDRVTDVKTLAAVIAKAVEFAQQNNRKFVPFVYLEGPQFTELRDYLTELGIEWVLQGTGDQHISYQQVLAQPQKYLPFIVSFVPEKTVPSRRAIGFAKGYLDNVSPNMLRDYFAEASYQALTQLRKDQGGLGFFLRLADSRGNITMLRNAAKESVQGKAIENKTAVKTQQGESRSFYQRHRTLIKITVAVLAALAALLMFPTPVYAGEVPPGPYIGFPDASLTVSLGAVLGIAVGIEVALRAVELSVAGIKKLYRKLSHAPAPRPAAPARPKTRGSRITGIAVKTVAATSAVLAFNFAPLYFSGPVFSAMASINGYIAQLAAFISAGVTQTTILGVEAAVLSLMLINKYIRAVVLIALINAALLLWVPTEAQSQEMNRAFLEFNSRYTPEEIHRINYLFVQTELGLPAWATGVIALFSLHKTVNGIKRFTRFAANKLNAQKKAKAAALKAAGKEVSVQGKQETVAPQKHHFARRAAMFLVGAGIALYLLLFVFVEPVYSVSPMISPVEGKDAVVSLSHFAGVTALAAVVTAPFKNRLSRTFKNRLSRHAQAKALSVQAESSEQAPQVQEKRRVSWLVKGLVAAAIALFLSLFVFVQPVYGASEAVPVMAGGEDLAGTIVQIAGLSIYIFGLMRLIKSIPRAFAAVPAGMTGQTQQGNRFSRALVPFQRLLWTTKSLWIGALTGQKPDQSGVNHPLTPLQQLAALGGVAALVVGIAILVLVATVVLVIIPLYIFLILTATPVYAPTLDMAVSEAGSLRAGLPPLFIGGIIAGFNKFLRAPAPGQSRLSSLKEKVGAVVANALGKFADVRNTVSGRAGADVAEYVVAAQDRIRAIAPALADKTLVNVTLSAAADAGRSRTLADWGMNVVTVTRGEGQKEGSFFNVIVPFEGEQKQVKVWWEVRHKGANGRAVISFHLALREGGEVSEELLGAAALAALIELNGNMTLRKEVFGTEKAVNPVLYTDIATADPACAGQEYVQHPLLRRAARISIAESTRRFGEVTAQRLEEFLARIIEPAVLRKEAESVMTGFSLSTKLCPSHLRRSDDQKATVKDVEKKVDEFAALRGDRMVFSYLFNGLAVNGEIIGIDLEGIVDARTQEKVVAGEMTEEEALRQEYYRDGRLDDALQEKLGEFEKTHPWLEQYAREASREIQDPWHSPYEKIRQ